MSELVGSLSRGSSGPRPVISSMTSETKPSSSFEFKASRSATTHCVMMPWISRRNSASGSFSSAARLSSSIRRRCRRTFASRSLSFSGLPAAGSGGAGAAGAFGGSLAASCTGGSAVASGAAAGGGGAMLGSGGTARRDEKRPSIGYATLDAVSERETVRMGGLLCGPLVKNDLAKIGRNVAAALDLVEGQAAIDRLADELVVVAHRAFEKTFERALHVGAAQAGSEQELLLETVDDHPGLRIGQTVSDRIGPAPTEAQPGHGHIRHHIDSRRSEQHLIGPSVPAAREVDHDTLES